MIVRDVTPSACWLRLKKQAPTAKIKNRTKRICAMPDALAGMVEPVGGAARSPLDGTDMLGVVLRFFTFVPTPWHEAFLQVQAVKS